MDAKLDRTARYSKTHEWARPEQDSYVIGISDFAQRSLGDIVYVDLPKLGAEFAAGAVFGCVESVKTASDVYLPVGGKVIAVNGELAAHPEAVNKDCYGLGWLVRVAPSDAAAAGKAWSELIGPDDYALAGRED